VEYRTSEKSGISYEYGTALTVMRLLDEYGALGRNMVRRIYVTYKGQNEIGGYVGQSKGRIKIPLLMNNARSQCGDPISPTDIRVLREKRGKEYFTIYVASDVTASEIAAYPKFRMLQSRGL
jgi:hypothetical protein